ncbi:vanadium-dependent haloperoxidase [Streptomyces sp. NPDC054887]
MFSRRRALGLLAATGALTALPATAPRAGAAPVPASARATAFVGDPVHYWNGVLLDVFRKQTGVGPGPLARAAAMTNVAIFDAVSAYYNTWYRMRYRPYLEAPKYSGAPFQQGPDEQERVIGFTARDILVRLFPAESLFVNQRFKDRFGNDWTAFDILKPLVAEPTAKRVWDHRVLDGSSTEDAYSLDGKPGAWRPTGGASCAQESDAVDPHWGRVQPFAIPAGAHFRPPTPERFATYEALVASEEYRQQVEEVRRVGSATASLADRDADKTAAAWFWANDADRTYKPPGQLIDHTRVVAAQRNLDTYENARLFALLSVALADAAIAEWDVKYRTEIDLWRPVSAIRDGLGDTSWQPLGATPCFPAWASGHAAFAGAWGTIMRAYFKTDAIAFEGRTDDTKSPVRARRFTGFRQAEEENAMSRLYLGVHYRWDATDGLRLGRDIGAHVFANRLQEI